MSSIQLQQSLRNHLIHKILEVCINLYANLFGSHAIILKFLSLHQMTPLHLAAKRGHLKIIKCLVGAKGTVVNVQDKKGVNAFRGITNLELASISDGWERAVFVYLLLVCQPLKLLVVPTKSSFQSQLDPMRMNMHPVLEIFLPTH